MSPSARASTELITLSEDANGEPSVIKKSTFYVAYPKYDLTKFKTHSDSADLQRLHNILRPKGRYVREMHHCVYCGTPCVGLEKDYFDRKVGHMMHYHPLIGWATLWWTLIALAVLGTLSAITIGLHWYFIAGGSGVAVLIWRLDRMYPQFLGVPAIGTVCPGHAELEDLRIKKYEAVREKSLIRFQNWRQRTGKIQDWDEKIVMEKEIPIWAKYNRQEMKLDGFNIVDLMGPIRCCPSCGHEWQNPYPEVSLLAVFNEEQIKDRVVIRDGKTNE